MRPGSSATDEPEVAVIGAGAAGLAAAAILRERGIDSVILERGAGAGESWRNRYERLHLNSVRWMSSLPGYLMERRHGDFPSRDDWVAYLERYAVRNRLRIERGVEVERIERDADGSWLLQTKAGPRNARFVVVAIGMDHTPIIPDWPGRDWFAGRLLHSASYRNAKPFADEDVVVVGAGNSATEIALDLAEGDARSVSISIRTAPLILPRRPLGISITAWALPALPLPDRPLDAISRALMRASFGDLSAYGLPRAARGVSAQRREGYVAPVDTGFVAAVKRGAIEVVPALERLDGSDAVLDGGRRLPAATVIAATGYHTGLAPLVGHLDVLGEDQRPLASGGGQLPGRAGLFFAGYHFKLIPTLPHVGTEARGIANAVERVRTTKTGD